MYNSDRKNQITGEWERFCKQGETNLKHVRKCILSSWKRSREHGVDPLNVEPKGVDDSLLKHLLKTRKQLLRISLPVIQNLYKFISGSRSILILSDENGVILSRIGDPEYLTHSKAYEPGIEYSERTVGTNGIGTTLYLDSPTQIWAAEHFAHHNHTLCCSAATIHDSEGNVIGCLNLSSLWDKVHTHTLAMVAAAANSIEQQLRIESVLENKVALLQEKQVIFELINDGLLSIDNDLIITEINERARRILGIDKNGGRGNSINDYILSGVDFSAIIAKKKSIFDQDVAFTTPKGVLACLLSATPITKSNGLVITIREAKSIRRMVNRYAGSRAVYTFKDIIGESPQIMESIRFAKIAGQSNTNTLILGESGTGKEIFAQAIHNSSDRSHGPFVAINCGALPRDLIQSELFGYAEGAFTGARKQGNPGKFELADGGTIFLDEIGEMPLNAQVNLLRVVETKEVFRLGDKQARPVDVRIIAATNQPLMQAITEKTFREDLYYRLNIFTIQLPPLRLRQGDIEVLIDHFLEQVSLSVAKEKPKIEPEALDAICSYSWPGNIRQLENAIERAVQICQGNVITKADLSRDIIYPIDELLANTSKNQNVKQPLMMVKKTEKPEQPELGSLQNVEYVSILNVLKEMNGNIRRSAETLGIARSTLYEKMRKYKIDVSSIR